MKTLLRLKHTKSHTQPTRLGFGSWAFYAMILSSSQYYSCGGSSPSQPDSGLDVTNGIRISESDHPSVVMIMSQSRGGIGNCTATFVNHAQVVTAAHCVEGVSKTNPLIAYIKRDNGRPKIGAMAKAYVQHPNYNIRLNNGVNRYDVAIVTFPDSTAPATSTIASSSPKAGEKLTIVGYGNNESFIDTFGRQRGRGAGVKRIGTNEIRDTNNGMIGFIGVAQKAVEIDTENQTLVTSSDPTGEFVSSGSGDSGGPMFVDGELVGVTSGGSIIARGQAKISLYVDLNSSTSGGFLEDHLL